MNFTTIQRIGLVVSGFFVSHLAVAGITMDRTRVIFEGDKKSITLNIGNNNQKLPYLAQGWVEDADGKKINSPLIVLPPVQRLEAGKSSQIKIESLPAINTLPQDRESLFFFNLREIPPKSDKPNVLQVALQTRVKLFYRPKNILPKDKSVDWQTKLTLEQKGQSVVIKNPTPYFVTIINAYSPTFKAKDDEFAPIMIAPFGQENMAVSAQQLGNKPTLIYINDYGGRPEITFTCQNQTCQVNE